MIHFVDVARYNYRIMHNLSNINKIHYLITGIKDKDKVVKTADPQTNYNPIDKFLKFSLPFS